MPDKHSRLPALFTAVMLLCVLFIIWYLPAARNLRYRLSDTLLSLETSRGRERKQQYEYDQAAAEIPLVQEELDSYVPLAEEAAQRLKTLKEERKKLRNEKKDLEAKLNESVPEGGTGDE